MLTDMAKSGTILEFSSDTLNEFQKHALRANRVFYC